MRIDLVITSLFRPR